MVPVKPVGERHGQHGVGEPAGERASPGCDVGGRGGAGRGTACQAERQGQDTADHSTTTQRAQQAVIGGVGNNDLFPGTLWKVNAVKLRVVK